MGAEISEIAWSKSSVFGTEAKIFFGGASGPPEPPRANNKTPPPSIK